MFLQDDHLTIRDALPSDAPQLVAGDLMPRPR